MTKRKSKAEAPAKPEYPKVFETYRDIGDWAIHSLTDSEPSCMNGWVRVRRYRVTVEEIPEPDEVLIERLQKLWDETNNSHHVDPLKKAAAQLGHTFKTWIGTKRKKSQ